MGRRGERELLKRGIMLELKTLNGTSVSKKDKGGAHVPHPTGAIPAGNGPKYYFFFFFGMVEICKFMIRPHPFISFQ